MVAHQQGDTQCFAGLERSGRTGDGETHLVGDAQLPGPCRLRYELRSGECDLDTVETDTFAALATS